MILNFQKRNLYVIHETNLKIKTFLKKQQIYYVNIFQEIIQKIQILKLMNIHLFLYQKFLEESLEKNYIIGIIKSNFLELSINDIVNLLNSFQAENSLKRLEENLKFIFKVLIKQLKKNFIEKKIDQNEIYKDQTMFYKFYFQKLIEKDNYELEDFFDPLNSSKAKKKSLNIDYLKTVFKSDLFKEHTLRYLSSNKIEKQYQSLLQKKFGQLFSRFEIFKLENLEDQVFDLVDYLRNNKQCKLPWLQKEIIQAKQVFLSLIEDLNNNVQ